MHKAFNLRLCAPFSSPLVDRSCPWPTTIHRSYQSVWWCWWFFFGATVLQTSKHLPPLILLFIIEVSGERAGTELATLECPSTCQTSFIDGEVIGLGLVIFNERYPQPREISVMYFFLLYCTYLRGFGRRISWPDSDMHTPKCSGGVTAWTCWCWTDGLDAWNSDCARGSIPYLKWLRSDF